AHPPPYQPGDEPRRHAHGRAEVHQPAARPFPGERLVEEHQAAAADHDEERQLIVERLEVAHLAPPATLGGLPTTWSLSALSLSFARYCPSSCWTGRAIGSRNGRGKMPRRNTPRTMGRNTAVSRGVRSGRPLFFGFLSGPSITFWYMVRRYTAPRI